MDAQAALTQVICLNALVAISLNAGIVFFLHVTNATTFQLCSTLVAVLLIVTAVIFPLLLCNLNYYQHTVYCVHSNPIFGSAC